MHKPAEKNRKLAVEISMTVTLFFIVLLYLLGTIVLRHTKRMYIEAHNEQITQELNDCRNLFMKPEMVGWVMDQWQSNPERVRLSLPAVDGEADESIIQTVSAYAGMMTEDLLKEFSGESLDNIIDALYQNMVLRLEEKRKEGRFDRAYCIDVRNDDDLYENDRDDYYVIVECSEETAESKDYRLGTYMDMDDTYVPIRTIQYGIFGQDYGEILFQELSLPRANQLLYTACMPVFIDGTVRYVICLEYDWSTFARILNTNLRIMSLWGILCLVAGNILLIFFIYYRDVRPLVKVNKGVLEYMENKDSDAAVLSMSKIRARNEIGRLADSFSDLTVEIERSTKENIQLSNERERVKAELDLAARIQEDSLPAAFPERPEIQLSASMHPAKEVGGDFYDFFFLGEDRLGLVIADVSGKGIPAALFMMMSRIMIKNYAMTGFSPAEVMDRTNDSLCENNPTGMFVTVWFGILDLNTGHIVASNAGHEYPMIRKPDSSFELYRDKHGPALGVMQLKPYTEYEFTVEPGGTLFVYTDGAAEATDAGSQLFGTDRMLTALNREADGTPDRLIGNMKSAIDSFVGDEPQFDDLTMMAVRYLGKHEKTT